jgi:tRNA A37 threonylcarbamoyladenosine dehydratase
MFFKKKNEQINSEENTQVKTDDDKNLLYALQLANDFNCNIKDKLLKEEMGTVTALERPVLFSSMGAALKMDPFRIKKSEFWKVKGDGLARALRNKFRKENSYPSKKFQCVWSDEILTNKGVHQSANRLNGSIAHTTAAFGLALAGLVLSKTD